MDKTQTVNGWTNVAAADARRKPKAQQQPHPGAARPPDSRPPACWQQSPAGIAGTRIAPTGL
jgi:hypothetical protein